MTWPQYLRRECTYKGWRTNLAALEAEIMLMLLMRGPRPTFSADLVNMLWGDDHDGGALTGNRVVHVLIGRLRAKLPGAIGGRHGFGWFLKENDNG